MDVSLIKNGWISCQPCGVHPHRPGFSGTPRSVPERNKWRRYGACRNISQKRGASSVLVLNLTFFLVHTISLYVYTIFIVRCPSRYEHLANWCHLCKLSMENPCKPLSEVNGSVVFDGRKCASFGPFCGKSNLLDVFPGRTYCFCFYWKLLDVQPFLTGNGKDQEKRLYRIWESINNFSWPLLRSNLLMVRINLRIPHNIPMIHATNWMGP